MRVLKLFRRRRPTVLFVSVMGMLSEGTIMYLNKGWGWRGGVSLIKF